MKRLIETSKDDKRQEWIQKLINVYRKSNEPALAFNLELDILCKGPPEEILKGLLNLERSQIEYEKRSIETELDKQKFRLGADPAPILREKLENEMRKKSPLDRLYQETIRVVGKGPMCREYQSKLINLLARKVALNGPCDVASRIESWF